VTGLCGVCRTRAGRRRQSRVRVWLTPAEWDTVAAAAYAPGMAPGAYAAQALLDVAERRTVNLSQLHREMVVALMQAAAHVSRNWRRRDRGRRHGDSANP
jgi:hypothetical protein